jgi:transposase
MRTIREILRLHFDAGLSFRAIARSCRKSTTTVSEILGKAEESGLSWPVDLTDKELESLLYRAEPYSTGKLAEPNWSELLVELKKKGVTRQLLWREYRENEPAGYGYSQFCFHLRKAMDRLSPVMRQDYKGGEKLFVDWAGLKVRYLENGKERWASIFVGALGASNFTFSQVYKDEAQGNWNLAHMECFEYLGGVPELTIPDNTKTGVTSPSYYEPDVNASYHELALHYNTAVMPTRVRKPQDKAKVETAVQIVEREIAAPLRKRVFTSFVQLRSTFGELLETLNDRPFSKLEGCRRSLFEQVDEPHLRPLPSRRYSMGDWGRCKVFKDYHIQAGKHYYSVPWKYIGETVDVRLGTAGVEIYHKGTRIACHKRSDKPGKSTTLAEHRPKAHTVIINRNAQDYLERGEKIGPNCKQAIQNTLDYFPHPEMSFRSCEGILRLAKDFSRERLEAASLVAVQSGSGGYKFLKNVLQNNRDRANTPLRPIPTPSHSNIRGRAYYAGKGDSSC